MACKTNFLKIVFKEDGKVYMVRCCGFEAFSEDKPEFEIPEFILTNKKLLQDFIFSKVYQKPENFKVPEIVVGCKDTCEKVFIPGYPITQVSIGIPTCNLSCPTCRDHQILHVDESVVDSYFKVLDALKGCGIHTFSPNISGEPFFYKKQMRNFINNLNYKDFGEVLFVSNLTIVDDIDIECLKNAKNRGVYVRLLASIDSVIEETFMKTRFPSTPKMYRAALENFDKLLYAGLPITPTITLSRRNSSPEELEALGQYFSSRNVQIAAVIAFGQNDGGEEWRELSKSQVIADWAKKYNVSLRVT